MRRRLGLCFFFAAAVLFFWPLGGCYFRSVRPAKDPAGDAVPDHVVCFYPRFSCGESVFAVVACLLAGLFAWGGVCVRCDGGAGVYRGYCRGGEYPQGDSAEQFPDATDAACRAGSFGLFDRADRGSPFFLDQRAEYPCLYRLSLGHTFAWGAVGGEGEGASAVQGGVEVLYPASAFATDRDLCGGAGFFWAFDHSVVAGDCVGGDEGRCEYAWAIVGCGGGGGAGWDPGGDAVCRTEQAALYRHRERPDLEWGLVCRFFIY